jgi:hydroxymethylbilane synthase
MPNLRIATRKSALALWQARHVADRLCAAHPGLEVTLVPMSSQGDRVLDAPLAKIGGKGLFVKELEQALYDGRADIAVHSMKDVPMTLPDGLCLGAIMAREDPRDALVSNHYDSFAALPECARVGTSSLRRQCQLLACRPDLKVSWIRGNVNRRLERLDHGDFDAIILAVAGLRRLGLGDRITEALAVETSMPAVGQGVLGIEMRSGDTGVARRIAVLNDEQASYAAMAERAMARRLNGGCQAPIAGYCRRDGERWLMEGRVGEPDGSLLLRVYERTTGEDPDTLGTRIAESLLRQGAGRIINRLLDTFHAPPGHPS